MCYRQSEKKIKSTESLIGLKSNASQYCCISYQKMFVTIDVNGQEDGACIFFFIDWYYLFVNSIQLNKSHFICSCLSASSYIVNCHILNRFVGWSRCGTVSKGAACTMHAQFPINSIMSASSNWHNLTTFSQNRHNITMQLCMQLAACYQHSPIISHWQHQSMICTNIV